MKVIQSSGSSQWFSWTVFHISVYGCFFSSTQKPKIPHNASVNLDTLELSADLTDSTDRQQDEKCHLFRNSSEVVDR